MYSQRLTIQNENQLRNNYRLRIMSDTRPAQYINIGGVMWPPQVTAKSLKAIKDFDMWEDDVWISSYLKSGTHWVAEIVRLVHNNGNRETIDPQQRKGPMEFEKPSHFSVDPEHYIPIFELAPKWKRPRVLFSHAPVEYLPRQILEEGKGKVINVIRNPKDVIVSAFYFFKGVKPGASETFSQCLMEFGISENAPYSTWFNHVIGYWAKRHHKQFLVLKYEEMKRDTRGAVIQIADFMGRPLSDEVIDQIVDLVQVKKITEIMPSPRFVRKGIVGDWKNHFTVAENEAYDALYRQKMAGSGLAIQFE